MKLKLSLRWKLTLLVAIPLMCYAYSGLYLLNDQRQLYDDMTANIYETSNRVSTLILNADRDMYQSYGAYLELESGQLDQAQIELAKQELKENYDQAIERAASAKEILNSASLLDLVSGESGQTIAQVLDMFEKNFNTWYKEAVIASDDGKFDPMNEKLSNDFQISRDGIDKVSESLDLYAKGTMERIDADLLKAQWSSFIGIIVVSIILITYVILTVGRVMRTIRSVVNKTELVAKRDLTAPRDVRYGNDELGQISRSVDDMIDSMNGVISVVLSNTKQVSSSSTHLTNVSKESAAASEHVALHIQEVANGSEVQARASEETSRAIEEMSIGIGRIAENTLTIADHSIVTSSQAEEGGAALTRLEEQMIEISTVIEKLSSTIVSLEKRSKQIGAIAENITTFSNQTNILSLNAAIEAARAGEQGKGFAVVAAEIRKLAASSLGSAENINELVAVTRNEIAGASSFMHQTMEEVERGSERVLDVSQKLELISASIGQMTQQLQENSAITEQMSASSEEVSASMEQTSATAAANLENTESVAAATEEQLALMETISMASQNLNVIVQDLNGTIAQFKVKE